MIIKTVSVGVMGVNCYIIGDEVTRKGVIIDPGAEKDKIINEISKEKLTIEYILLTHGHFDHIGALDQMKDYTGAKVLIHEKGTEYLSDTYLNLSESFFKGGFTKNADTTVVDEEIINVGNLSFKVIHTPGHTTDGVNYYEENNRVLFSGDNLFKDSIGRTDFPKGNLNLLLSTIKEKLFTLPENVKVYPGHGEPTTIGYEKVYNIYLNDNGWDE